MISKKILHQQYLNLHWYYSAFDNNGLNDKEYLGEFLDLERIFNNISIESASNKIKNITTLKAICCSVKICLKVCVCWCL